MKIKIRLLLLLALIIIVILLISLLVIMQVRMNNLNSQKKVLNDEISSYSESISRLNYLNSLSKEEYISRFAREKLGYHSNDEMIFKFNYGK